MTTKTTTTAGPEPRKGISAEELDHRVAAAHGAERIIDQNGGQPALGEPVRPCPEISLHEPHGECPGILTDKAEPAVAAASKPAASKPKATAKSKPAAPKAPAPDAPVIPDTPTGKRLAAAKSTSVKTRNMILGVTAYAAGHPEFTAEQAAAELGCTASVVRSTIKGYMDRPVPADFLAERGLTLAEDKGTWTVTALEPKAAPKPRAPRTPKPAAAK